VRVQEVRDETGLTDSKVIAALGRLEDAGAMHVTAGGEVEPVPDVPLRAAVLAATEAQMERREFDRSRVAMIRAYAESRSCRRAFILEYFGEPFEPPCGNCDICLSGVPQATEGERPFPLESRVVHGQWGEGTVLRYDGDTVVVLFDRSGYKTLALALVLERNLLRPLAP
jgi:ATP-dependent DNA helicase RecQ